MNKEVCDIIKAEAIFYKKQRSNWFIDCLFQRPAFLIQTFLKHLRYLEVYDKGDIRYY